MSSKKTKGKVKTNKNGRRQNERNRQIAKKPSKSPGPCSPLAHPIRYSVIHGTVKYTWRDTYQRCCRLASALSHRQIGPGCTHIHVYLHCNVSMGKKRKTSMGKQKIEIKKLESESARQVCFSKRKSGIFSKASEIATLCGAQIAILIDSPAGCPFSFGSPSVMPVLNRFLYGGIGGNIMEARDTQRLFKVRNYNNKYMDLNLKIDEAKKKKAILKQKIAELAEKNEDVRRAENAEYLNLTELRKLKQTFTDLRERIKMKMFNDIVDSCEMRSTTRPNFSGAGIGPSSSATDMISNLFEHGRLQVGQLNPTVLPNTTNVQSSEFQYVIDDNSDLFEHKEHQAGGISNMIVPYVNKGDMISNLFEYGKLEGGQINAFMTSDVANVESCENQLLSDDK